MAETAVIGSWLLKLIAGFAIVGVAAIELGSPLVARAQADDAAHQIATEVSFALGRVYTKQVLDETCAKEAARRSVTIASCEVTKPREELTVVVRKEAFSLLLGRFDATDDWYTVEASATVRIR